MAMPVSVAQGEGARRKHQLEDFFQLSSNRPEKRLRAYPNRHSWQVVEHDCLVVQNAQVVFARPRVKSDKTALSRCASFTRLAMQSIIVSILHGAVLSW